MDPNPYASPANVEFHKEHSPKVAGDFIRHKVFLGKTVSFKLTGSLEDLRETVRRQAENFINEEVGVENVVSVAEHAMSLGPFTIVVWYRSRS